MNKALRVAGRGFGLLLLAAMLSFLFFIALPFFVSYAMQHPIR